MTVVQWVGQTGPSLPDTLYQQTPTGPQPLNLTGATVRFRMMPRFGGDPLAPIIDAPATIIAPATAGTVRYDWQPAQVLAAGAFVGWWHITLADGITTFDSPDFAIQFMQHGALSFWGPSVDWCSSMDVLNSGCAGAAADSKLSSAVRMASELLYERSGGKFPGQTQAVVRPCRPSGCGWWSGSPGLATLDQGHIVFGHTGWLDSYGDTCGCAPIPEVLLAGFPVVSVDQVKLGGQVFDSNLYRLDDNRRLVRSDGQAWPVCQNLALPDSEQGTWSVTYTFGTPPPELGFQAAIALACEFYGALTGGACRLPSGVTQLVRQGVTVSRVANAFGGEGAIGIEVVDAFLATYGSNGRRPAAVWSPDMRYPRRIG